MCVFFFSLWRLCLCRSRFFSPHDSSRYRVADNVNLPLRIIPAVQEEGRSRVTINLKVSADFNYKLFGSNIVVKVGILFVLRGES